MRPYYNDFNINRLKVNEISHDINICQDFLSVLDECKSVIESFDGKVPNRRLSVALNNIKKNPKKIEFHVGLTTLGALAIIMYDTNNRLYEVDGVKQCAWCYDTFFEIHTKRSSLPLQPRLDATSTIEELEKFRLKMRKEITRLRADLKNFEKEKEAWKDLLKQVDAFNAKFSHPITISRNIHRAKY